jgi:16S rRNA (cytosine967-C5)-methyltransferase
VCIYAVLSEKYNSQELQDCFTEKFRYPEHLWEKIHTALETEYIPNSEAENIAYHTAFPIWFTEKLLHTYSAQEVIQLLTVLNQNAKVHLRVNTYISDLKTIIQSLKKEGIEAYKGNISPDSLIIEKRKPIFATETFKNGLIEMQDEGSQVVAWLVNPKAGKTVLDACAGGGGKTLHLATLMKGKGTVFAYEVNSERFGNIKQRIRRSQLQNIQLLDSEAKFQKFTEKYTRQIDYVLIDAPCSASGTLRRNPDLKLRLTKEQVENLPEVQLHILKNYQKFVRKGGRLVYVTCSVFEQENQVVVEKFLSLNPDFKCIPVSEITKEIKLPVDITTLISLTENQKYLQLLPQIHDTDGFFIAVLERTQ